jgi:hypothetical protein
VLITYLPLNKNGLELIKNGLIVNRSEPQPFSFVGLGQTIPVALKTIGQLFHVAVLGFEFAHRAQVVAIRFMLRKTNDLALAKFNQQRYVSLAYGRAQLAAPGQRLSLLQEIAPRLLGLKSFAEHDAGCFLSFPLWATAAKHARQK